MKSYFLVRHDLSNISKGKIAAHVAHSTQDIVINEFKSHPLRFILRFFFLKWMNDPYSLWIKSNSTKIVLSTKCSIDPELNEHPLVTFERLFKICEYKNIPYTMIKDITLNEVLCFGIGPTKENLTTILCIYKLL